MTDRKETLSEDEQNLCEELTNQLVEIAQTLIEEGYHTRSEVIEMVQQAVVSKEK